jgi:hypothetical protein
MPAQPPEAVQVCAAIALHCNVAAVPLATLLLMATSVTAGAVVPPAAGFVAEAWPDDDCWHAANAAHAAHVSAQRSN